MNSDSNQYPIDYLNQIAPQQKKPGMNNRIFLLIIGIGAVLAIVIGALLFFSNLSSGPTKSMQTLAARLQTLQSISDKAHNTIKNNSLRSTNSTLKIFLTNANHDIVTPLENNDISIKKLDKKIVASEDGEAITATLENARLNAQYDNTYAREMSFQLATVAALMTDIYAKSDSQSMKKFLVSTDNNLQPIREQLDAFYSTNS